MIKDSKSALGTEDTTAIIFDFNVPSEQGYNIGIGSTFSESMQKFTDFLKTMVGITSIQLQPQGKITQTNKSPYSGTNYAYGEHIIDLKKLTLPEYGELLTLDDIRKADEDYSKDKLYTTNIPHSLSAKDTIYVSFANLGVLAKDPLEIPAVANNLTLSRSFFMIDKNGNRKEIDPARLNLNDEFYIELHLQNTSDRGVRNLALTQIIPSGWEIQNMRIVRQSDDEDEMQENIQKDFANRGYVSYMDILRDRVVFFFDNWISPTYEYYGENEYNTYKVYIKCVATLAGSYVLGGAFAEAMYDGDYNARTKAIRVQVQ